MRKLTTEEFIEKASKVHGDKYDYSLVEYVNRNFEIKIICSEHGIFLQTPSSHQSGNGCQKCSGRYKYDTEEYIEKAIKIHADKYDYSLVEYKNSQTKVKIICPVHGVFKQVAISHFKHGCSKCGNILTGLNKVNNNEIFIKRSKEKHGNKYDYSLVKYKNAKSKVKIICSIHGIFEQLPDNHKKHGCKKCATIHTSNQQKYTIQDFIKKSNKIHKNKYDYSQIKYKGLKIKINIICQVHGEFSQTPSEHISGRGCNKCGYLSMSDKQKIGNEEFIKRSNKTHKKKYDYSLIDYFNYKTKVKIICPIHGLFNQRAGRHYEGSGCPKCSEYGDFNDKYLYLFYDIKYNLMKIGVSKNPEKRLKKISKSDTNIKILKTYEKSGDKEFLLHKKYEKFRTSHTLYEDGNTEWFNLNESEVENIDKFIKSQI